MLFADGLKDAFVGVAYRCGQPDLAVYSVPKAIKVLVKRDGMTYDEAQEYLEFNSIDAWVGKNTPVWLFPMSYEACVNTLDDDEKNEEEGAEDQPQEKVVKDTGYEPQLRTPGLIARELGEPLHRIQYLLRTRNHIRPSARAGNVRLFDREAVSQLRHELNAIDARRSIRI